VSEEKVAGPTATAERKPFFNWKDILRTKAIHALIYNHYIWSPFTCLYGHGGGESGAALLFSNPNTATLHTTTTHATIDAIRDAASRIGMDPDYLIFEINAYAE